MLYVAGTLTLFGVIFLAVMATIALISLLTHTPFKNQLPLPVRFALKHFSLYFGFLVALLGVTSSLYLSEIDKLAPCLLCWYQRTMFYSLPLIFLSAMFFKDNRVRRYIFPVAAVGSAVALFHYFVQLFPEFAKSCGFYSVSCSIPYTFQYGFISIPMMSLTGFLLVLFFAQCAHYFNHDEK